MDNITAEIPPVPEIEQRRRGRPRIEENKPEPSFSSFIHLEDARIRLRYRNQLDVQEALSELARIRRISELASEEINTRLQPKEDSCMICGSVIPKGRAPIQPVVQRDPGTGTIQTFYLCSVECVRQHNKRKMGLAELIK